MTKTIYCEELVCDAPSLPLGVAAPSRYVTDPILSATEEDDDDYEDDDDDWDDDDDDWDDADDDDYDDDDDDDDDDWDDDDDI